MNINCHLSLKFKILLFKFYSQNSKISKFSKIFINILIKYAFKSQIYLDFNIVSICNLIYNYRIVKVLCKNK